MNVGNYFIGVAVGVAYYNLKKAERDISKIFVRKDFIVRKAQKFYSFKCFRVAFYLCVVIGFMTILSAYFFYKYEFVRPAVWISVLAVLLKHTWGVIVGFGILGAIYRYGWFIPSVFNYPGWRVMGRISFATFMCHLFVLKMLMSGVHQPMYLSVFSIVS